MNVNNRIIISCLLLNCALLFNYILWFLSLGKIASFITIPAIIIILFFLICSSLIKDKEFIPISLFIIFLILTTLSTPTVDWDARSIWLFHAKRIFWDQNLFSQMDNYAAWSHNYYPVIIPSLSASIATFTGFWNEILPKSANIAFLISPLYIIGAIFNDRKFIIPIIIGYIYICDYYLYNGYMDATLAIQTIPGIFITLEMMHGNKSKFLSNNTLSLALISTFWSISCLIKNEGMLIFSIFTVVLIASNYYCRRINIKQLVIILCPPFIFSISWKITTYFYNVHNIMDNNFFQIVYDRITNMNDMCLIADYFFSEVWVLCILAAFALFIIFKFLNRNSLYFASSILIIYTGALGLAYISTPHNLKWHLETSANRTLLTSNIISFTFVIFTIHKYFTKNNTPDI